MPEEKQYSKAWFTGKPYTLKYLKRLWQEQYPTDPMPQIFAYTLKLKEYLRIQKGLPKADIKEYGYEVTYEETAGFTVRVQIEGNEGPRTYFVFKREDAKLPEIYILKHEFKHIHDGDV